MTTYPILVDRWTGMQALTIACERCDAQRVLVSADELSNEDIYDCPQGCGGTACMAYYEGERCKNCRKLDYSMPVDGCCSRVCKLQADYAASLKASA